MKHLYVINPAAGGKKATPEKTRGEIASFAESRGGQFQYEIYMTKSPMDACAEIKQQAKKTDDLRVYACGGDGTLNECVNGAAGLPNVAVTHYPLGTGNDFVRMFGEDDAARFRDLKALADGTVRPLDLIDCNGRYGVNICSVGIDARVGTDVHKYSRIPIIGGSTGYVISLVVNIIKGVRQKFKVTREGRTADEDISLACACNGRFYGGGFNPVPDAIPDDGILEFLTIAGVSRLKAASVVGKYSKGRFRELGDLATYVRGDAMRFRRDFEFVVNVDGEGIYSNDMTFKLVPHGVNFLFPAGMGFFDGEEK
jgi:YegS/Rv2252/BmrU family lipid kinase